MFDPSIWWGIKAGWASCRRAGGDRRSLLVLPGGYRRCRRHWRRKRQLPRSTGYGRLIVPGGIIAPHFPSFRLLLASWIIHQQASDGGYARMMMYARLMLFTGWWFTRQQSNDAGNLATLFVSGIRALFLPAAIGGFVAHFYSLAPRPGPLLLRRLSPQLLTVK